ncbi:hypothetical protein [Paenibacillus sp. PL2-23]|uniref:ComF family protein n=1 Tax=Paenibacillus sp. PL2-23 TaxID=2100729 RepID=UPI0030FA53EF
MSIVRGIRVLWDVCRAAGGHSAGWMAPRSESCVVCGQFIGAGGASVAGEPGHAVLAQALCGRCRRSIPWLVQIRCPVCGRAIHCEDCGRRRNRHFVMNRSAVAYDPVMRSWLALYKYRGRERLAPLLAEMLVPPLLRMAKELERAEGAVQARLASTRWPWLRAIWQRAAGDRPPVPGACWDAITFVPISAQRAEERGFNQAEQLARHLSERFGMPLFNLLVRAHHSEKMSFKSRAERLQSVKTMFNVHADSLAKLEARSGEGGRELRLLLIDDIYTTGSTVEACSEILLRHARVPLRIYVLTWSRS